jgi:RND family efflux transporter MFP subunit
MRLIHGLSGVAARPRRQLFLAACAAAGLLGLAVGCHRPAAPSRTAAEEPAPGPPNVAVVKPQRKTVRRSIKRPGFNVEANQSTALYAKISGYVRQWNRKFDIGSRVREGDVLADLRVPEMEVEVGQKAAAVLQAQAEIGQARAEVLRAQAEYDRAKSQSERLTRVDRTGVVTREVVDEARLSFQAAEAGVAKANADVGVAQARLQVALKVHEYAQTLLRYTKIVAPFDGVVTRRKVNDGDFVQPAAGGKGEALFVVDQVDPVRVFVHVPEPEAVWVRGGDAATVRSPGLRGQEFRGTVTRDARSLDPENRTLRTEIDLPNPEGLLLPGMYVDVTITVEHRDVWTLPESAVVDEEDQSFCYRVEGEKAVRIPLQPGLSGGGLVEVRKKQGKAAGPDKAGAWEEITGEEVVVKGDLAGLKDGQALRVSPDGK